MLCNYSSTFYTFCLVFRFNFSIQFCYKNNSFLRLYLLYRFKTARRTKNQLIQVFQTKNCHYVFLFCMSQVVTFSTNPGQHHLFQINDPFLLEKQQRNLQYVSPPSLFSFFPITMDQNLFAILCSIVAFMSFYRKMFIEIF